MRANKSLSRCSRGENKPTRYSMRASATNAAKIQPSVLKRPLNTARVYVTHAVVATLSTRCGRDLTFRLCRSHIEASPSRQPEALPDNRRGSRLIERVEMQPRCAAANQLIAKLRHDVQAEGADRSAVIAEAFQLAADPTRNLGSARVGEACELGKLVD